MTVLELEQVISGYGSKEVLHQVSLTVTSGEILGLIGHNGAGKTTLLHTVFGLVPVISGRIRFDGAELSGQPAQERVKRGLRLLPSSHALFPGLSVEDNIRLAVEQMCVLQGEPLFLERDVFELFPELGSHKRTLAGNLSGGQQRMLSTGMLVVGRPRFLLLDELSIGLAPNLVQRILSTISELARKHGFGLLIVEQSIGELVGIIDRLLVIRNGRIVSDKLLDRSEDVNIEELWELF